MNSNSWQEMYQELAGFLPNILGALLILVGGWIVALIVSKLVTAGLHKTRLDDKFGNWVSGGKPGKDIDIERGVGKGVFWLIMLFVLVAFFQALGLTMVTEPLNGLLTQLTEFAPRILGAGSPPAPRRIHECLRLWHDLDFLLV